jgi:hypothetical protein
MNDTATPRRLCKGAKAIARRIGDGSLAANLRLHPDEWPCFLIGDVLVAYEDAIDAALAEKERVGLQPMRPITRKRPASGTRP